jgi:hypothetical protein
MEQAICPRFWVSNGKMLALVAKELGRVRAKQLIYISYKANSHYKFYLNMQVINIITH